MSVTQDDAWRHWRSKLQHHNLDTVGLAIGLAVLVAYFSLKSPYFFSSSNALGIGLAIAVTGILASVQTIVIVSGSIDLSFMAILALCGIAAHKTFTTTDSLALAVAAAMLMGVLCGLVNAAVVVGARVNPLIATIGTQFAFRGAAYLWLGTSTLPYLQHTAFNFFGPTNVLRVPVPVIVMVLVILTTWVAMRYWRFGARVYALGGSELAARRAAISVPRLRTLVFILSGLSAGIGGIVYTALNGTAFADAGVGDELYVIAAVILGGTALTGGKGSVFGTTLGVILLGVLANGLNLLGVNPYWQVTLSGCILVFAVVIDEMRKRSRER